MAKKIKSQYYVAVHLKKEKMFEIYYFDDLVGADAFMTAVLRCNNLKRANLTVNREN